MRKKVSKPLSHKQCHYFIISALSKLNSDEQKEILENMTEVGVDKICETLYNCLYSRINMNTNRKSKLRKLINDDPNAWKYICKRKHGPKQRCNKLKDQAKRSKLKPLLSQIVPVLSQLIGGGSSKAKLT